MPTVQKTPSEVRQIILELGDRLSSGAALVSATAFASRKTTLAATTLAAACNANDTTLSLDANPGIGAFLTVDDGAATEEQFKVSNVTGSAPWICTLTHAAMYNHASGATVDYEPGVTARLLVSASPAVDGPTNEVYPFVRRGAEGHTYRVSVIGVADNGEEVEGEVDLVVSEVAPNEPAREKQPAEIRDLSFGFAANLAGGTLDSATAFASHEESLNTTVAGAGSAAEAATIPLTVNPGVGALITVNPASSTKEIFSVSAVGGSGPFDCTITPTAEFAHSASESVTYELGETARLLASATATIMGDEALLRARRGDAEETYRLKVLGVTSLGETLQHTGHLLCNEI